MNAQKDEKQFVGKVSLSTPLIKIDPCFRKFLPIYLPDK